MEWCNKWANYYHDAERALSKQQHSHRETHPRSICLGCQVCFTLLYFLKSHLSIYSFSFTTSSHRRHSPTSYNEINCDNNFLSSIRMFCSLLFIRFLPYLNNFMILLSDQRLTAKLFTALVFGMMQQAF